MATNAVEVYVELCHCSGYYNMKTISVSMCFIKAKFPK